MIIGVKKWIVAVMIGPCLFGHAIAVADSPNLCYDPEPSDLILLVDVSSSIANPASQGFVLAGDILEQLVQTIERRFAEHAKDSLTARVFTFAEALSEFVPQQSLVKATQVFADKLSDEIAFAQGHTAFKQILYQLTRNSRQHNPIVLWLTDTTIFTSYDQMLFAEKPYPWSENQHQPFIWNWMQKTAVDFAKAGFVIELAAKDHEALLDFPQPFIDFLAPDPNYRYSQQRIASMQAGTLSTAVANQIVDIVCGRHSLTLRERK